MHHTTRLAALTASAAMTIALLPASGLAGSGTETQTYGAYDRGSYGKSTYADAHVRYASDPDISYFTAGKVDNDVNADPQRQVDRNFFVFDLYPTDATVIKAELVLKFNGAAYLSEDDSEAFALYEVSSDIDALRAGGDSRDGAVGLDAIWDDLGSGHKYGSRVFTAADQGKEVRIELDGTAGSRRQPEASSPSAAP